MTYEGVRLKIQKFWRKGFAPYRLKKLNNTDFTIISNNCWAGMIYESYGLYKQSPTVGLFFMADDYIKFLKHLKLYLSVELRFIEPETSRWKEQVSSDKRFGNYPIGILEISFGNRKTESIEIFFLHYESKKYAKEKWERRITRIKWEHLLIKFNDQNGCTEEHIRQFDELPFENKVCITAKKYPQYKSIIKVKCPSDHEFVRASYEPYGRKITEIINDL